MKPLGIAVIGSFEPRFHVKEPTVRLTGEALVQSLHALLTQAGLRAEEADGMIACWRPQFFATPGNRFVLVMSARDYDMRCPLQIRPAPTELARVGLVLFEFPEHLPAP